jgi:hypothetical protein
MTKNQAPPRHSGGNTSQDPTQTAQHRVETEGNISQDPTQTTQHRVSAAYLMFLLPLLALVELQHHKSKVVKTRAHQGCYFVLPPMVFTLSKTWTSCTFLGNQFGRSWSKSGKPLQTPLNGQHRHSNEDTTRIPDIQAGGAHRQA